MQCDRMLPGWSGNHGGNLISGIDICRSIKDQNMRTRMIIMTAHDEFDFAYQAIKIGIDDYLLKPFDKDELVTALRKSIAAVQREGKSEASGSNPIEEMTEGSTKFEIMSYEIDEYLKANYSRPELSQTLIGSELGFDSSYLRKAYKTATGITIMQKLEDIRLSSAKKLLSSGKYQHQEISRMVGFSDPLYFSRRFRQVCGMSPSEYENQRLRRQDG